jgi:carboxymethylenebutenolidase
VHRTVVCYATRAGDFTGSVSHYLFHLADRDAYVTDAAAARIAWALRSAGRPAEIHRYPGTTHAFAEPNRPEYDSAAARLAGERTLRFLTSRTPAPSGSRR